MAREWLGRLRRSGREEAGTRLAEVLGRSLERWLWARGGSGRRDVEVAFGSLIELEEFDQDHGALAVDGGLEGLVRRIRRHLRAEVEGLWRGGDVTAAARDRVVGRAVDHADDAVLSAGECSPAESARRLERALVALDWQLESLEPRPGPLRSRLERRRRRVELEWMEQDLQAGLERRFGARRVALWERGVVLAILVVVGMLVGEALTGLGALDVDWSGAPVLLVDTAICAFLLTDFAVKLVRVKRRGLWLRRHVWTDLVPALPFGLLAGLDGWIWETGQASRVLRLVRLARMGAYLRALRPLVWALRAFGFLTRGLDRVVRRHAAALETEVIVFPTPEEQREAWRRDVGLRRGAASMRRAVDAWYATTHELADDGERAALEETRERTLERALQVEETAPEAVGRRRDQLPLADDLLRDLSVIGGAELVEELGSGSVERLGRAARVVASSPLRWLPGLRSWAAPDALGAPPAEHVARGLRAVASSLHGLLGRALWWADLHGTLTPGEVVGRLGAALVARTSRPAVRLLLFGALYLAVELAFAALDARGDEELRGYAVIRWVRSVVGPAFVVLGGVCLVLLAFGAWLQRLARDTTTFHERVARAQFLHLTDSLKARAHGDDATFLAARVFGGERRQRRDGPASVARDRDRFLGLLQAFLRRGDFPGSEGDRFDPVARTVLLYRDQLDGALLAHSDTRATSQLLGNLSLTRLARESGRVSTARQRWMQTLDLERRRTLVRGPFLWFHAITRALESRAARLIVEYNAHAIPSAELARASAEDRAAHEAWLAGDRFREVEGETARAELTTAFTVLHFLDDQPARDEEVARRFGARVLERMRGDRRALVRTVFGTYPLHELPLESRVLNLRGLYAEWLQGGRVLWMPLRAAWRGAELSLRGTRGLARAVGAIRRPGVALGAGRAREAGFDVAARKIHRMRGPAAVAALELRAILDPEYHGLLIDGDLEGGGGAEAGGSLARADARYLGVDPSTERRLAALERRALRDLARIRAALDGGLRSEVKGLLGVDPCADPELLRALFLLIHGDVRGVRVGLFAEDLLVESVLDAVEHGVEPAAARPRLLLRLRFQRWWRAGGERAVDGAARRAGLLGVGEEGGTGAARRRLRRSAWRVVAADEDGARRALEAAADASTARRAAAVAELAAALRHPSRVSEQLVTLRAAQSLTLLDVRNYRAQVWRVGRYAEDGDPAPEPPPGPPPAPLRSES